MLARVPDAAPSRTAPQAAVGKLGHLWLWVMLGPVRTPVDRTLKEVGLVLVEG